MSTTKSKADKIIPIEIPGLEQIKEVMEKCLDKRLDDFQRKIDLSGTSAQTAFEMHGDMYYPTQSMHGNPVNTLTPHEVHIKKESFNRGLEAGLYIGAGIALLCFAKIFR